jgi:phosphoribosylglycinamide formyltransferase-1
MIEGGQFKPCMASRNDIIAAMSGRINIAVLISGGGTTLKNLIGRIADGSCRAQIKCVLSSRAGAPGLKYAEEAGLPGIIVPRKEYAGPEEFSEVVTQFLAPFAPELIVLGGFLSLYLYPPQYNARIINTHPALLPCFGGKGMYGTRVHEAVLASGCKVTGCTVHMVDHEYDHGPIIAQRALPVLAADTVETLGERVRAAERELLPEVVNWFADGRVELLPDGKVYLRGRNLAGDSR